MSSIKSNTSHEAAGLSSLEGVVLSVGERREEEDEDDVNCQTSVNLVISRGIPRGFFNIKPTATGSVERYKTKTERVQYYRYHSF